MASRQARLVGFVGNFGDTQCTSASVVTLALEEFY